MNIHVEPEEVWAAGMKDTPGALAAKLAALAEVGADLDFIIARRAPDQPGAGVVFVTPLHGDREFKVAAEQGFSATSHLHSLRVEGQNQPGLAASLLDRLGKSGINLRGMSGAVIGAQFVLHLAFDRDEDAHQALALLRSE